MIPRTLPVISMLLAALACAGNRAASPSTSTATPSPASAAPGSLARFAGARVVVLPLQSVGGEVPAAWRGAMGSDSSVIRSVDRAIEEALAERGLSTQWSFPPALERAARRNPTYVTDPYRLRAGMAIRAAMRKPGDPIAEPFASQLRALAGVSDARYALVPVELRVEPDAANTSARTIVRLAAIDARGSQLSWVGDVTSDALPGWGDTVLREVARRVADLVVLR